MFYFYNRNLYNSCKLQCSLCNSNSFTISDSDPQSNANPHSVSNTLTNTYSFTNPNAKSYTKANPHTNSHPVANSNSDAHTITNPITQTHPNTFPVTLKGRRRASAPSFRNGTCTSSSR